jgi:ABC-type dipeptide/oligopeptide/nickel transport system ATPase component
LDETVSELGTSLILISHDVAVVASMTDRIYVMYGGRVVESGRTTDVLNRPQHPYTQVLLRSVRSLTDEGVELYSIPPSFRSWLEGKALVTGVDEQSVPPVGMTSGKKGCADAS